MYKVFFIPTHFMPIGKKVTRTVPTDETTTGFFGGKKPVMKKIECWEQTGWSDCRVDGKQLGHDLEDTINQCLKVGYRLISVSPVISGSYQYAYEKGQISSQIRPFKGTEAVSGNTGYSYGFGFSYTDGLIVVLEGDNNDLPQLSIEQ